MRRSPLFPQPPPLPVPSIVAVLMAGAVVLGVPLHCEGQALPRPPRVQLRVPLPGGDCRSIQRAIDTLPGTGGLVALAGGTYTCALPIVIARDNVALRGVGPATVLRLAPGANAPVLVLGRTEAIPSETVRHVRVSDLTIDGNRTEQTQECMGGPCSAANPLRNNCITLRRVVDAVIERVRLTAARSGGLVSELGCRELTLRDIESSDNHFDGVAAYETEESLLTGLRLLDNRAAGLSFDIAFNGNLITDTVIARSGTVGVFMRDSRNNVFANLQVRSSGEHGVFLAQVDGDAGKPAAGNTFIGLVVSGSAGAGVVVNDASCVNNALVGGQLVGNQGGGLSEAVPGLLAVTATLIY